MKYIYLISSSLGEETIYKIGFTRNSVEKRINQLKTGSPAEYDIVKTFEADKYGSSIEKYLHKYFEPKKIDREWFSLTKEDIKKFIPLCEKHYNNLELIDENNLYRKERNLSYK